MKTKRSFAVTVRKSAPLAIAALSLVFLAGCGIGNGPATTTPVENAPTPVTRDTEAKKSPMTFFVTSANPGKGADLWGLEGADAYCQSLAEKAGSLGYVWKAYLSATASSGTMAVNARDRIGKWPWHNAQGVMVATDLDELHASNFLNKETSLDERGNTIMGRGDDTNLHDILTGSNKDGTASGSTVDTTCSNWTASGSGSAIVGHHDRRGLDESEGAKSWNSSHLTRGCDAESIKKTGGGGFFYCFATTP